MKKQRINHQEINSYPRQIKLNNRKKVYHHPKNQLPIFLNNNRRDLVFKIH